MQYSSDQTWLAYTGLYHELNALFHTLALRAGLSDAAFLILYSLCALGDGCRQADICRCVAASKKTVHSAIHRLEQDGYLRLLAGKGREKQIFLTDAGRRLTREQIVPVIRSEVEIFGEMTETERAQLLRLTERYLLRLREKTREVQP